MLKISPALPFLLCGLSALLPSARIVATGVTAVVVRDISVLDPTASRWLPHQDIVVNDTSISQILPTGTSLPSAKFTIEGAGKFAIPGLFDNAVSLATVSRPEAGLFIAHGITSVRDVGTNADVIATWQRDLSSGKFMGPRVIGSTRIAGDRELPSSGAGRNGLVPGSSLHERMRQLAGQGMTTAQTIRRATIESAQAAGRGTDLGSIEIGKIADFIVLDGDPLAAIASLSKIDAVVFRGEVLTRAHLNQLLSRAGSTAR
jgi:imidazolonepropionase-like amidohydrolase